jgi:hypothetical protein
MASSVNGCVSRGGTIGGIGEVCSSDGEADAADGGALLKRRVILVHLEVVQAAVKCSHVGRRTRRLGGGPTRHPESDNADREQDCKHLKYKPLFHDSLLFELHFLAFN